MPGVVSVFSPKGGVGKTTITLALADVLSSNMKKKVCVVEFDFSPGDFAAILDIDKDKNIMCAINLGYKEAVERPPRKKFDVITGGYPDTHERFTSDTLKRLVDDLTSNYEIVIFDIQPGLIANSLVLLENSNKILSIVEDSEVVKVRLARVLDWLQKHSSVNFDNVLVVGNKIQKITHFPRDILCYTVPYFKGLVTYENKALKKSLVGLAQIIAGQPVKKRLFGKNANLSFKEKLEMFVSETIKKYGDTKIDDETFLEMFSQNLNNSKTSREGNELVYVNTEIPKLDEMLKNELKEYTDDINNCKIMIVSATDKEKIDQYVSLQKDIVLLTISELAQYAKSKGIKNVLVDEFAIPDIIAMVEKLKQEKGYVSENSVSTNMKEDDTNLAGGTSMDNESVEKWEDDDNDNELYPGDKNEKEDENNLDSRTENYTENEEEFSDEFSNVEENDEDEDEEEEYNEEYDEMFNTEYNKEYDEEIEVVPEYVDSTNETDEDVTVYATDMRSAETQKVEHDYAVSFMKDLHDRSLYHRPERTAVEDFDFARNERINTDVPQPSATGSVKEISENIVSMLNNYITLLLENAKKEVYERSRVLEQENENLKKEIAEKDIIIEQLKSEKQQLENENKRLRDRIVKVESELQSQRKVIERYEQFKRELYGTLKRLETVVNNSQIASVDKKNTELHRDVASR